MPQLQNASKRDDMSNIVALEHVNLTVPDQELAIQFYLVGLGLTRDPYMFVGPENMWANVGNQQFHLPTRANQAIPGHIGVIIPDLEALKSRLSNVEEKLAGTSFSWSAQDEYVQVSGPWGNQFRCYCPNDKFGDMGLGISYVEFNVKPGSVTGISSFYKKVLGAPSSITQDLGGSVATIGIGRNQSLVFRETDTSIPPYDGHHIAVYIASFSKPYNYLKRRGLIMEEINNHQFRFKHIVDPGTDEPVMELEHEVRSMFHPMYQRYLVNRNPVQTIRAYVPGRDSMTAAGH